MLPTDESVIEEDSPEPLLTASEVARRAKVHTDTIRRWAEAGLLESITLPSGHRRFRRSAVDEMLKPSKTPADEARAS
jgi:excisionase family DNA binding protein